MILIIILKILKIEKYISKKTIPNFFCIIIQLLIREDLSNQLFFRFAWLLLTYMDIKISICLSNYNVKYIR